MGKTIDGIYYTDAELREREYGEDDRYLYSDPGANQYAEEQRGESSDRQSDSDRRSAVTEEINKWYREILGRDMDESERASEYEQYQRHGGEDLRRQLQARAGNDTDPNDGRPSGSSNNVFQSWSGGGGSSSFEFPDWYKDLLLRQQQQADEDAARNRERGDALYNTLLQRSQQSLAIDRMDPIIRVQADAYGANQERARRNYLADLAESAGPLANLRGEQRLAAERVGQQTGAFEAELLGRELSARRQEIADALSGMAGLLTADQARQLQLEMGLLDQAIAEQNVKLGYRGQDIGLEQFLRQLAFNEWDRTNYWDSVRRGLL